MLYYVIKVLSQRPNGVSKNVSYPMLQWNIDMKQWKGACAMGLESGEKQYEWKYGNARIWGHERRVELGVSSIGELSKS